MTYLKSNFFGVLALVFFVSYSVSANAWHGGGGGGGYYGHGGGGYYHGGGGYYHGGGGYYHGGGGYGWGGGGYWGGSNFILNVPIVPVQPYSIPAVTCEKVRVCDNFEHRCWYERYCD